ILYGDMKKQLAEDIIQCVATIRKKINELLANEKYLKKVVTLGCEAAIDSAEATICVAGRLIGINYF
ncbi:MAG: tryptophan--tRNA ligase, partial [Chitinophagales bacterium]